MGGIEGLFLQWLGPAPTPRLRQSRVRASTHSTAFWCGGLSSGPRVFTSFTSELQPRPEHLLNRFHYCFNHLSPVSPRLPDPGSPAPRPPGTSRWSSAFCACLVLSFVVTPRRPLSRVVTPASPTLTQLCSTRPFFSSLLELHLYQKTKQNSHLFWGF